MYNYYTALKSTESVSSVFSTRYISYFFLKVFPLCMYICKSTCACVCARACVVCGVSKIGSVSRQSRGLGSLYLGGSVFLFVSAGQMDFHTCECAEYIFKQICKYDDLARGFLKLSHFSPCE